MLSKPMTMLKDNFTISVTKDTKRALTVMNRLFDHQKKEVDDII